MNSGGSAIEGHSLPFMLVVMFVELSAAFGDRYDGWSQFGVFVDGLGVIVGAFLLVHVARWRQAFRLPNSLSAPELAAFVLSSRRRRRHVGQERQAKLEIVVLLTVARRTG